MKITIDTSKITESFATTLTKATDAGKKAVTSIQESTVALTEKAKQDSYERRLKKYNPVFLESYRDNSFILPSMIIIADESSRKGIDVCEGALGWKSTENGIEVLHLYETATKISGIQFVPNAASDAVYYADAYTPNRFIRLDCIFDKAHEERLAELEYVAHSLGAKSCTIEITESSQQMNISQKKAGFTGKALLHGISASSSESAEAASSAKDSSKRTGRIHSEFEGSDEPRRPKLKWYAHDEGIKKLIDMRCKGNNTIKSKTLELSSSSSATMSQKTARAIDGALSKLNSVKGNSSMEMQAITENSTKLIFHIEF